MFKKINFVIISYVFIASLGIIINEKKVKAATFQQGVTNISRTDANDLLLCLSRKNTDGSADLLIGNRRINGTPPGEDDELGRCDRSQAIKIPRILANEWTVMQNGGMAVVEFSTERFRDIKIQENKSFWTNNGNRIRGSFELKDDKTLISTSESSYPLSFLAFVVLSICLIYKK